MDDLFLDHIEGGLDHDYDPDLHRDLDLELGNRYNDGPFAALAGGVGLIPRFDYAGYDIEYHAGSEQGSDLGNLPLDEQSVNSESIAGHPYSSSVPDSIAESSEPRGSLSDTTSEEGLRRGIGPSSDDDSEEENLEDYDTSSQEHHHISDEEIDESEPEDYGSPPLSSEDELAQDLLDHLQASDSSEGEAGYSSSEDHEDRPAVLDWEAHRAAVEALTDEEVLANFEPVHEIDDVSDNSEAYDISDEEVFANFYDIDVDGPSPGQSSDGHSDDAESFRTHSYDDHSHISSDDDHASADQFSSSPRPRSATTTSSSEGLPLPPSSPQGDYLGHYPRGFDDIRNELDGLQEERRRLEADLRQLRGAHFRIPPPLRRANVPNGIDYFLDRLPAPQRDAHGLLAQMERDLERNRQRRRAAPSPFQAPPRPQPQREHAVIDLTGDSDSPPPEVIAFSPPPAIPLPAARRFSAHRSGHRDANPFAPRDHNRNNPRRNHRIRRAPSFARSDGSILAPGMPAVIDLTEDAPEAIPPPRRRRDQPDHPAPAGRIRTHVWEAANMNSIFRQMGIPRMGADFLQHVRVALGGGQADYEVEFIGENRRPGQDPFPIIENPLADNPVDFNYGANGFHQEAARPKPAHIAPPEPREGFTRSTGEDTVVICPSCEEELKYNPDDKDAQPRPVKKARHTRKDREEHHFWAVKACGHVYCRSCYENRRSKQNDDVQAGFPMVDKKVICAVEDCTSDVSNKTSWVGIFL